MKPSIPSLAAFVAAALLCGSPVLAYQPEEDVNANKASADRTGGESTSVAANVTSGGHAHIDPTSRYETLGSPAIDGGTSTLSLGAGSTPSGVASGRNATGGANATGNVTTNTTGNTR